MLRPALLIPRRTANNSITTPRIDAASSTRSSVPVNPSTANHAGTLNLAAAADADTTANSRSVNRTVTLFPRPPSTRVRRETRTTRTTHPSAFTAQRSVPALGDLHPQGWSQPPGVESTPSVPHHRATVHTEPSNRRLF